MVWIMTKSELTKLMVHICKDHCTQVAEPQYYAGEGPFIIALDDNEGESKLFCFSIADTPEFLAHPEALPLAFYSEDFLFVLADHLELEHLENTGNYYKMTYTKIVPDEAACRVAVQKLWYADAKTASYISLLGPDCDLKPAKEICNNKPLLS
jgi:hypothetical protein